MERDMHKKHIPYCPTRVPMVNQYMWTEKDRAHRTCENGISHSIYAADGNVSYTLPLDQYPKVNAVHPQIEMSKQYHFGIRDPNYAAYFDNAKVKLTKRELDDIKNRRIEGFYYY
jgi:hypothetical protein